jgi:dimethylamine--corrinoid protein Co-methyltransferase
MTEIRSDLGLGVLTPLPGVPKGIEAKFNIARVLDIDINCVNRFKERTKF